MGERLDGLAAHINGLNQADRQIVLNMFSQQMHFAWEQKQTKLADVVRMAQDCIHEVTAWTEPVERVTVDFEAHENPQVTTSINMIFNYERAGRKFYQPFFNYFQKAN